MPVSPDYAAGLAKTLLGVYEQAEERLLRLIARQLARNLTTGDASWQERALRDVQTVRVHTQRIVETVDKQGADAITDAVWTAYNRGVSLAGMDMVAAGMPTAAAFGAVNTRGMNALVDTAKSTLGPSLLRIQSAAPSMYADVVQQTAALELAGTLTRREAAAHSLRTWADRGVTGFVDRAGRNWSMPAYAEMTARTAAGQAMVAGHVDRLREQGHDLVMVSDAPEECALCRAWEGKVLSLTGQTPPGGYDAPNGTRYRVAGTLAQAVDAGFQHPNCRHRLTVYLPGVTRPLLDTADPEGDELRQKQRAYERDIRRRKRRVAALEPVDPAAARAAKKALREKQLEFRYWREDHGRKDLAYRTSIAPPKPDDLPGAVARPTPDVPVLPGTTPAPKPAPIVAPPPPATGTGRPRRTPPAEVLQWNARELRDLPDDELGAQIDRALTVEDVEGMTPAQINLASDRLFAEFDRRAVAAERLEQRLALQAQRRAEREAQAAQAKQQRAEARQAARDAKQQAEWDEIDRRIEAGEDPREAIEDVTGYSVEKQLRDELRQRLVASGAGLLSDNLDKMLRLEFHRDIERRYLEAENYTQGHMLKPKYQYRGDDPALLFSGSEAEARRKASDELKEWWDINGRPTFAEFKEQQLYGASRKRIVGDFLY